nr:hypothetical protein CFP56_24500 [Quercus suber]
MQVEDLLFSKRCFHRAASRSVITSASWKKRTAGALMSPIPAPSMIARSLEWHEHCVKIPTMAKDRSEEPVPTPQVIIKPALRSLTRDPPHVASLETTADATMYSADKSSLRKP